MYPSPELRRIQDVVDEWNTCACGLRHLLDLFCGGGGCSVGYARAGFHVFGVDVAPHADYPFAFLQADAMDVVRVRGLSRFDVIHASPPCPRYSVATRATGNPEDHPDLIPPVRQALADIGTVYVMENVPGAPLVDPVLICAQAMGMAHLRRHRLFETNAPVMSPGCLCSSRPTVSVYGDSGEDRRVPPTSYTNGRAVHKGLTTADARRIMDVEWMNDRSDISDAIPPAYTHYIGEQLIDFLMWSV